MKMKPIEEWNRWLVAALCVLAVMANFYLQLKFPMDRR